MRRYNSFHPFYAPEGAGSGDDDGVVVELNTNQQATNTGVPARVNKPKIDDVNKFSFIKGIPYNDIASTIASHIVFTNQEPFEDRDAKANGYKRQLLCFWLRDKSASAFKGTKFYDKLPEVLKNMTIGEMVKRQFTWSKEMSKEFLAEFIKIKIPIANGYALCRLFQYNNEGFITAEYRPYSSVKVTSSEIGNAVERQEAEELEPLQYTLEGSNTDDLEVADTTKAKDKTHSKQL